MQRIILHIDFDSFFASCEQQFNPQLRNKPIGVTATNGRTCIIAASREAKRAGVKSPSRTFEAQTICPDLICVPAHFDTYWEISKKFISIAKDYTPFVEVFSLDEVFMDITKTYHLFGGVYNLIDTFKKRLAREVGEYITVSIGISHNKLLAKLASGLRKPNGVMKISKENLREVYAQVKLTDICGIGERIRIRLHAIGIYTLLDLQRAPLSILIAEFGNVEGLFLKSIGAGVDDRKVIPYTEEQAVKSVGRNYCLPHNEYNSKVVLQNFFELCEEVSIKLRRLRKKARTLGFSLRGDVEINFRKTYQDFFNTGTEMYHRGLACIGANLKKHYIRQISVWASGLRDDYNEIQLSTFENTYKKHKLTQAIDKINEKFGDHTIRSAFLLRADKLTTKPNGYMADKYEREILRFEF